MPCEEYNQQLKDLFSFCDDDWTSSKGVVSSALSKFNRALLKSLGLLLSDAVVNLEKDAADQLKNYIKDIGNSYFDKITTLLTLVPEMEIVLAAIMCFQIREILIKRVQLANQLRQNLVEISYLTDGLTRGLPRLEGEDALIIQVREALFYIKDAIRNLSRYNLNLSKKTIPNENAPGKFIEIPGGGATQYYNNAIQDVTYAEQFLSGDSKLTKDLKRLIRDIQAFNKTHKNWKEITDTQILAQYLESNRQYAIRKTLIDDANFIANKIPFAILSLISNIEAISRKSTTVSSFIKTQLEEEDLKNYQKAVAGDLASLRKLRVNWESLQVIANSLNFKINSESTSSRLNSLRSDIEIKLAYYDEDRADAAYSDILFSRTAWEATLLAIENGFAVNDALGINKLAQATDETIRRALIIDQIYNYINDHNYRDYPYDPFILTYLQAYPLILLATVSSDKAVRANQKTNESLRNIDYAIQQDNRLIHLINQINIEGMAAYKAYQILTNNLSSVSGGKEVINAINNIPNLISKTSIAVNTLKSGVEDTIDAFKSSQGAIDRARCLAEMILLEKVPPKTNSISSGLTKNLPDTERLSYNINNTIIESRKTALNIESNQLS